MATIVVSSRYQVYETPKCIVRFTTKESIRDREVVSLTPGLIEDSALPSRCHTIFCCLCCHCSPCCTETLDRARIHGITNFEIFLKEKYGQTAFTIASTVLNINLSSLRAAKTPLLLADALSLQTQTEKEYQKQIALQRHLDYYYLAKHPEERTFVTERSLLNCSLANMIAEITTLSTIPKVPLEQVGSIAEAALNQFPATMHNTELNTLDIRFAIIKALRLKGFEIQKPDHFVTINLLVDTEKWWECFATIGETFASQIGIRNFRLYLESQFGMQSVVNACVEEDIDLGILDSLSKTEAEKIYNKAKLLHSRGDLFYAYMVENYGLIATHTALGLKKVTIESLNLRSTTLHATDKEELLQVATKVWLRATRDYSEAARTLHFYYLLHITPFPPETDESKAKRVDEVRLKRAEDRGPSFSIIDIRKKIEEIPYLHFEAPELAALSALVFEKIQGRVIPTFDLEIIISKAILAHVARSQGKTIEEVRAAKLLIPEPTLLAKLTTLLGADTPRFMGMLQRTPLEHWTPADLAIFFTAVQRGHARPSSALPSPRPSLTLHSPRPSLTLHSPRPSTPFPFLRPVAPTFVTASRPSMGATLSVPEEL